MIENGPTAPERAPRPTIWGTSRGVALLISLAALVSAPLRAQGAEHYVTTQGELFSAISAARPGDVITMANGRWTNTLIPFNVDGVEGDSIRLQAETRGGVVLDGASTLNIAGDYLVVDGLRFEGGALGGGHVIQFRGNSSDLAHHSRLTNTTVVDYNPADRATDYKWVSIYGTHNRVDHSYFAGKDHAGATMVVWLEPESRHEPSHHRIDHNHFGPRPPLGTNGGETIRIGTSGVSMQDAYVTVEHNLFERCNGEAEIISNKSGRNVFRSNTLLESQGALTLRHGNASRVEGNFFIGRRRQNTGGVRVIGEDHVVVNNYFELLAGTGFQSAIAIMNGVPNSPLNRYFQVRNVVIAHNTIVRTRDALTIGAGADSERTLPPENVVFHNNVILSQGETIVGLEAEPIDMTWDGTFYWGGSLGIEEPPGARNVNPLLQPSDDELWRPLDDSPLINAAVGVPGLDLAADVDGQPRDAASDIGADERSTAPITRRPLTAADVGPSWPGATPPEPSPEPVGALALDSPFPNPAAGAVTVPLTMAAAGRVEVAVYDALGRRVVVLLEGDVVAGTRALHLDAGRLAAGTYTVVARAGGVLARTSVTILPSR